MPAFLLLCFTLILQGITWSQQIPPGRHDYQIGTQSAYIVHGDFNNDGIVDLASTDENGSAVSVLLGKGDGTFAQPSIDSATGIYPAGIAAADFNGDHKLDLVVLPLSSISGTFELLLGNGDGTFQPPQEIAIPTVGSVDYVQAADLNHDGHPDLIFAYVGLNQVLILLGNGDGTFQPAESLHYGGNFSLGDFNHDGNLDIATSIVDYGQFFTVLLGNGDGTFQSPIINQYPGGPVASADFNSDGLDDLILNFDYEGYFVALSNGNGTFQQPVPLNYQRSNTGLDVVIPAIADLNGDGKKDLVIVEQSDYLETVECCSVSVLLGNGDGTFERQKNFQVGPFGSLEGGPSIAVADFNGDGNPDVAVPGGNFNLLANSGGTVSVLLGNGMGGLSVVPLHYEYGSPSDSQVPAGLAVGDLNRDGNPDVAVVDFAANRVVVFPGQGNAQLASPQAYPTGTGPSAVLIADLNHDGRADLVTANAGSNDVSILIGNASGFAPAISVPAGLSPGAIASADLNHDGIPDLVVADAQSASLTVLIGDGLGGFSKGPTPSTAANPNAIAIADFDHDGNLDLAVSSGTANTVSLFMGDGSGKFSAGVSFATPGAAFAVVSGDFNRDGKVDLAIVDGQGSVLVALGNGNGSFQSWVAYRVPLNPVALVVADFNADGFADLASANAANNDVSILYGTGTGTFAPATSLGADFFPSALAVGDFNHQGYPELVVGNPFDSRVTLLPNVRSVK